MLLRVISICNKEDTKITTIERKEIKENYLRLNFQSS